MMIERGQDRRRGVSSHFSSPMNNRRRPEYDRRGRAAVPAMSGTVRPGFAEAAPREERRRYLDAGME
jgi:hypothetical protein